MQCIYVCGKLPEVDGHHLASKVLHIHVVHFGTILIDCVIWVSSMQENCQTKLQVFHGRLELVSTWCECGEV